MVVGPGPLLLQGVSAKDNLPLVRPRNRMSVVVDPSTPTGGTLSLSRSWSKTVEIRCN